MDVIIEQITVVNNRTNREYKFETENDIGLNLRFFNNNELIEIRQLTSAFIPNETQTYINKAIFRDFSVCSIIRREMYVK